MVYHEIRDVNGKKQNYLVFNKRKNEKWVKKSKFIGTGVMKKEETLKLREEFEKELKIEKIKLIKKEQAEEIENLKQVYLDKINALSREEFENFEKSFFTELTYNSNAIEGNSLSLAETSLVINENIAPKGKELREIFEAKNHAKALEFIKEYSGEINELFILKLHSIILENISEKFAGRYRETSVKIFGSNVSFPDASLVPQLVGN